MVNVDIKSKTYNDFFVLNAGGIVSFYASQTKKSEAWNAFYAYSQDTLCGVLFYTTSADYSTYKIRYVYVDPHYRQKGICTRLIKHICDYSSDNNVKIKASITFENPWFWEIDNLLKRFNFEQNKSLVTVMHPLDEEVRDAFIDYLQIKGKRIIDFLTRKGFHAVSFAEASPKILDNLKEDIGIHFQKSLDPFALSDSMLSEYSIIVLKETEVVAYSAVTLLNDDLHSDAITVSALSVIPKYRNYGVFALPIISILEKAINSDKYRKIIYSFSADNNSMDFLSNSEITTFPGITRAKEFFYLRKI